MNFAFAAFLIALILLPAFFYRTTLYYSSRYRKAESSRPISEQFVFWILPSLSAHFILLVLMKFAWGYKYNFHILTTLLTSNKINQLDRVWDGDEGHWKYFIGFMCYNITVNSLCLIAGYLHRHWANFSHLKALQKKEEFNGLRLYNEWYYLLAMNTSIAVEKNKFIKYLGFLQYFNVKFENDTNATLVDVLVKVDSKPTLYTGYVHGFHTNGEKLEKLVLYAAVRRDFCSAEEVTMTPKKEHYYVPIDGQRFVIPGDSIINLNIQYHSLDAIASTMEKMPIVQKQEAKAGPKLMYEELTGVRSNK